MINSVRCRYSFTLLFCILLAFTAPAIAAQETETETATHKVVYQLNKADPDYIRSVLFSVTQLKEKYGDDIEIVVVAIGPGIHLLALNPERPVDSRRIEQAAYLEFSGVQFHACGNTLTSLGWDESDLVDYAEIVPIGADDLMLLQEQGYSYISW